MRWFPIGPDFVFAPRNAAFKRLSRRNEGGRQGLVSSITVDASDPSTIYVVERPSSGGTSAFRTLDGGDSWTPIADSLQRVDPNVDPSWIAINPSHPEIVYMSTWGRMGVYVSNDHGGTWGARNAVAGNIRKLLVDPNTAADPAHTVIYAVTNVGVFRSADGGTSWTNVLSGDVWSFVANIPASGTPHFYAGVWQQGVFHTTDPTAAANWTNLNTQGIGLPAHSAATAAEPQGNFDAILLDLCPRNPNRVYAWTTKVLCDAMGQNCNQITAALYTTSSPLTAWTSVAMTPAPGETLPPGPAYGFYAFNFAVAPNSPGDGANDILFFGAVPLYRSTNGGQTWTGDATWFHADQHSMAFFPESPPAGVVPVFYAGNDGGIAMSTKYADPAFAFATAATYFNEGLPYSDSGVYQNLNHGKQSSAVYQYASDPTISALGYIGCQDTGVSASSGAFGWRDIADADAGAIANVPGADGVVVWGNLGAFNGWPSFRIFRWIDHGDFTTSWADVRLGAGGPMLNPSSNFIVGLDSKCLTGAVDQIAGRTLTLAIAATGVQAATPSSMTGIMTGSVIEVDSGNNAETVTVTTTTATTFTANFAKTHATGAALVFYRAFVARLGQDAVAAQISQDLGANSARVDIVAASPVNADVLYCATNLERLWTTGSGSTASSSTVWTEVTGNKPVGININAIAIDVAGSVFVLLANSITTTTGDAEFPVTTTSPLFKIVGGNWVHQTCAGVPSGFQFGNLLADPVHADTLYASHGARVYKLTLAASTWNWTDISDGLPGQWIYDLWVGNVAAASAPAKILLRAAIPTRGVWECDATDGASVAAIQLYVRDNLLDQGWFSPSLEGMLNPHNPAEQLWHYQCADLKIDARQNGDSGVSNFFQTDPEGTIPPTHVLFDQLLDNSSNLPGSDQAWVHVQVRNRAVNVANNVRVWAIYCNASAGVPALSTSAAMGNAFNFWGQFSVTGQIIPNLPADSPWTSVGAPATLSGIEATNPKVASWPWTIPLLASGDPGHYCMLVFVHSALSPLVETSMDADDVARRQRQVGQKNLHIGPPLPPSPAPGGGAPSAGGQPRGGSAQGIISVMEEYVEFHNPTPNTREATLVLDMRTLPAALSASFKLTELKTAKPLRESVTGVRKTRQPGLFEGIAALLSRFFRWLGALIERLGCRIENLGRWFVGLPLRSCKSKPRGRRLPRFEPTIYEMEPSGMVEITGVMIPPFGFCATQLAITNSGTLAAGSKHRFEVQQLVKGEVVGGSTFVVLVDGEEKQRERNIISDSHRTDLDHRERERIEREAERFKYVPPWAKEIVERREEEQGRKS
jgi:hypothetical protein